jgi:hypothetical protein
MAGTVTELDQVRDRLRQLGIDLEILTEAPWVPELERRFRRSLPPLYRSVLLRFSFLACEIGEVELFGNVGIEDRDDITVAPFCDPYLSSWLIDHKYIQFGRPGTGSYDPVCFDYSVDMRGSEPAIVCLDHEDILLERKKVRKTVIADNFATLLGLAARRTIGTNCPDTPVEWFRLEDALKSGDADGVQHAIFEIGNTRDANGMIPDETAFGIIGVLRRPEMKASPLAGHVLNFFEFESPHLTLRAKDRCIGFLREWGSEFTHFHARQIVAELRAGRYLKA